MRLDFRFAITLKADFEQSVERLGIRTLTSAHGANSVSGINFDGDDATRSSLVVIRRKPQTSHNLDQKIFSRAGDGASGAASLQTELLFL
jgi:hypothetical protein